MTDAVGLVLLYHRIGTYGTDPWSLAVTPEHFDEHLDVLRRRAVPIPLAELIDDVGSMRAAERAVAITFDDGYADVVEHGVPRLVERRMPATFFLTSAALGGHEFWWDELERLLLGPVALPADLQIDIDGATTTWSLGRSGPDWPSAMTEDPTWRAWHTDAPSARHALYRELWQRCQPLSCETRANVLEHLRAAAAGHEAAGGVHRTMTWGDAQQLATSKPMDVGAHSVTHAQLACMTLAEQAREIGDSKRSLEDILGVRVTTFAYPYGGTSDFTTETVRLVREAGFRSACVNVPGVVSAESDRYQIPRLFVHDWDGDEFARRLVDAGV